MMKNHACSLLYNGVLRIGTLYDYKNIEKYGSQIGDKDEGTKSIHCVDTIDSSGPENINPFIKNFIRAQPGAKIHIKNCSFIKYESCDDFYVLSLTEEFNKKVMNELEYNSCIKIENTNLFLDAVTDCLKKKGEIKSEFFYAKCIYIERTQLYSDELKMYPNKKSKYHPALIKDPAYKNQKEVRAVWVPKQKNIKPIIIECKSVCEFCSMVL